MKELGRNQFPDDVIKVLWMQTLPAYVQRILVASESLTLVQLSVLADNILEVTPEVGAIQGCSSSVVGTDKDFCITEILNIT